MWTHDADPTDGLQINKFLQKFKKDLAANPKLIQEFVNKYFVVRSFSTVTCMWSLMYAVVSLYCM